MGVAIAALCSLGICRGQWCLTETAKGRRLVDAFGTARALFLWRMILLLGAGFGTALAAGFINPVSWD
ncbi:MAG: hypothetical protein ACYTGL_09535 [Planctomycetota bacterium]|jgi:hypothetical protein